jgi:deoxyadenosine kinase
MPQEPQSPPEMKSPSSPVPSPVQLKYDFNASSLHNVFIGISGMIGAGKSTLAKALAGKLGLPVHYEPVMDNVYLADFYADMGKYAFQLQVYLLNRRFKQQQQIVWQGEGGVQDRTIYEDSVFARMLHDSGYMDDRDYTTYLELFKNMSNFMKKPNIIVHLDVSPEESMARIKMRSRGCETGVTLEYLEALHAAYEDFVKDISRVIPVIRVDYSQFRTAEEMAVRIAEEYERIANIREVAWPTNISNLSQTAEEGDRQPEPAAETLVA